MNNSPAINFNNSYVHLPERFYSRQAPVPVAAPAPIQVNAELAVELGIDPQWLASAQGTAVIAGNTVPDGAEPLAAVYAGHQFGSYNPQLGDGRALLLGEVISRSGQRFDIQLKGSGRTRYSRGGDGRAPLGPVLREYLVSEAMHTLGVPTSRALAAVTTGETVYRDRALPGAVLARVARSHIRIGSFQFFAAAKDTEALQLLATHVLERHYPDCAGADNPLLSMLETIIDRQAALVSRWQLLGFIHGVMNTDNMLVSGETIDYGPCAFMDQFNPDTVFSSIDHGGRYAYRNQPAIAHWNLAVLAQALVPLLHEDSDAAVALAQAAVDQFPERFLAHHSQGLNRKLGLATSESADSALVEELFTMMSEHRLDFTLTFRWLTELATADLDSGDSVAELYALPAVLQPWLERWQQRLAREPADDRTARQQAMLQANPAFIPRNHLVEQALAAAIDCSDYEPFYRLQQRLQQPFRFELADSRLALPPEPAEVVAATFCGT